MAWYYGTYSCGHEGRVQIYGKEEYRQWKADRRFEGLCPDCWEVEKQKRKESEYERACQIAQEMDLPELQGTEKQVHWAMVIRQKFIDQAEEYTSALEDDESKQRAIDKTLEYYISEKTKASWWIDNRMYISIKTARDLEYLVIQMLNEMKRKEAEEPVKEVVAEATVYPEQAITNAPVEIKVADDKVSAIYEKNEKFREIVRGLGYSWNGSVWEREITQFTGSAVERAAELGNKLLNAGFPVTILDNEARQKAIDGSYEPECKRWISRKTNGEHAGKLTISWPREDDLYSIARKLPGAKWDKGSMIVRPEHYEEVEEFARLYGFRFSTGAIETIEEAKRRKEVAIIVQPAAPVEDEKKDGLKEILNSSNDVLDDLKDD